MTDLPRQETCREWVPERVDRCDALAVGIVWGKLEPPDAMGPRCEDHIASHHRGMSLDSLLRQGWAIYDLRPVNALHG